jgi:hypothetical protein
MGVSDPEIRKKVFGPRWQHEIEKQGWPPGVDGSQRVPPLRQTRSDHLHRLLSDTRIRPPQRGLVQVGLGELGFQRMLRTPKDPEARFWPTSG